jgi:hypothetical protein
MSLSRRLPSSLYFHSLISLSPHLLIYVSFPPVPRHLPNHTLSSVLAIELWVNALAALINVETFAALLTKSRFVFLTNSDRLPIRVFSTLHLIFSSIHSRLILPQLFLFNQCPTKHFSNQGLGKALREFNLFRHFVPSKLFPAISSDLFSRDVLARP